MATIEQKLAHAKEIKERDAQICQDFRELRRRYPEEKVFCLFETLAMRYRAINKRIHRKLYPITTMGVRDILMRNNKYKPKPKTQRNGDSAL